MGVIVACVAMAVICEERASWLRPSSRKASFAGSSKPGVWSGVGCGRRNGSRHHLNLVSMWWGIVPDQDDAISYMFLSCSCHLRGGAIATSVSTSNIDYKKFARIR